uniref:restriction endonuclease subunit S n=2 Tax=Bacteroides TaxID=816 RepID=UPI003569AD1D
MRFPEFSGEWKKCKFGDIATGFDYGMNAAAKPFDGENKYIRITDIDEASSTYNDMDIVSPDGRLTDNYVVNDRDILLARTGASTGKSYLYRKSDGKLYYAGFLIRANITEHNPYFVFSQLHTHRYWRWVSIMSARSGQPGINSQEYSSFPIFTTSLHEENKISTLLSLLNERIVTQNKIIDRLQSLIKGLTDTLLENPLWQKTYLRSFMQFYSTNSLSWGQLSYEEGEIRNLHYGLIHSFQTSEIDTDSLPRILPTNVPKQYTLCQAGDVAFADASEDTNEIGKAVEFIRTHKASVICGLHTIHGRDIKCKTLLGFKRVAFNSHYFHDQIKRLAQGTKVFSITSSNLSSCYIYIPDIVMQKSIVVLFKAYEEQLITNKRLLEQYEKQKRYLLQQMFI